MSDVESVPPLTARFGHCAAFRTRDGQDIAPDDLARLPKHRPLAATLDIAALYLTRMLGLRQLSQFLAYLGTKLAS